MRYAHSASPHSQATMWPGNEARRARGPCLVDRVNMAELEEPETESEADEAKGKHATGYKAE